MTTLRTSAWEARSFAVQFNLGIIYGLGIFYDLGIICGAVRCVQNGFIIEGLTWLTLNQFHLQFASYFNGARLYIKGNTLRFVSLNFPRHN